MLPILGWDLADGPSLASPFFTSETPLAIVPLKVLLTFLPPHKLGWYRCRRS